MSRTSALHDSEIPTCDMTLQQLWQTWIALSQKYLAYMNKARTSQQNDNQTSSTKVKGAVRISNEGGVLTSLSTPLNLQVDRPLSRWCTAGVTTDLQLKVKA